MKNLVLVLAGVGVIALAGWELYRFFDWALDGLESLWVWGNW
ncbi:MAG TPA: hypothetical protein VHE12_05910 [bacterium]|nr:hypothetical protein [bacterium]